MCLVSTRCSLERQAARNSWISGEHGGRKILRNVSVDPTVLAPAELFDGKDWQQPFRKARAGLPW
jgi:hypothetical protein